MTSKTGYEPPVIHPRLEALRKLQESLAARGVDLAAWEREARAIRRDSFSGLSRRIQRLNRDDSKPRERADLELPGR